MIDEVEFQARAIKDLQTFPIAAQQRIIARIEELPNNLAGDVKRLTHFAPEYRLRVGDYRVLFEVEGAKIIIYRVKHRSDAYRP